MSEDVKPLPEDLARFVRAERDSSDVPEDAEARVMARLMTSIAPSGPRDGGGGASPIPAPTSGTAVTSVGRAAAWSPAVLVGVFALGVVTGVVGMRLASSTDARPAPPPPTIEATTPRVPEPAEGSPPPSALVPTYASPSLLPSTARSAASAQPSRARQLADEQAILDVARAALNRSDGAAALGAVDRHEQRYPSGLLSEEREVLGIQALLLLSRTEDARARGARFEQRYPRSVLLPTVQAAIGSQP
jgi:hypothetical protein